MPYLIIHKVDDFCSEYETISWDDFGALCEKIYNFNIENHGSKIVITFDDGYESDLQARSIAREWQIETLHFVVPTFVGTEGYMSQVDIQELGQCGAQVGVHSYHHSDLKTLSDKELISDIDSCLSWANEFIKSDRLFYSIPYGKDDKNIQYHLSSKFEAVFTTGSITYFKNVYRRVGVNRNNIKTDIAKLLEAHTSKYWFMKYYSKELFIKIFGNNAYKFLRNMR